MELTATTTVTRPVEDVYAFWRDLERLATFMAHLDDVRTTGPRTSHWKASAPFDTTVEWDAEIVDEVTAERIAWRSVEGADIDNAGEVIFAPAPGGRGTEVRVTLRYDAPAGPLGKAVAKYFGEEPSQQLDDDLRRFKQVMETGEVVRSDGAPWGKRARKEFPQRPAQPLTEDEWREIQA
ncbi:SRPBCC family protein [uncultured Cellulomonas sp.]|uniref:SRPBCC family protein n=1 Tax=uncultured Cellulomonas sp. TaxID=189682 RepID=UPI00261E1F4C|nr:SRPBCC family protein [uncultured Cellulomonas sp.]